MADEKPKLEAVPEAAEVVPETVEDVINNEPPEPPGYVGTLNENEIKLLNSLRGATNQLVLKIGQLEIHKAHVLAQLGEIEVRSNAIIAEATQRFGVEGGGQWTVTPDGKVIRVNGG